MAVQTDGQQHLVQERYSGVFADVEGLIEDHSMSS
jgi:hypothetical protein